MNLLDEREKTEYLVSQKRRLLMNREEMAKEFTDRILSRFKDGMWKIGIFRSVTRGEYEGLWC